MQTCYRHPDRQAGVICQRCDRPICPSCMHQASVGFHCPSCTKAGAQKVYQGISAIQGRPVLTQVLVGINLAVFVIGLAISGAGSLGTGGVTQFQADFGLAALFIWDGELYRLISSGFLHSGLLHLGMNMWVLWVLGQGLERMGTRWQFGAVYLASLLTGSLGALIVEPGAITVGASGAILGIAGAIVIAQRARGIALRDSGLLPFLVLTLVISFLPGISFGGHLGGFIGGCIVGWAFYDLGRRPSISPIAPWIITALVAVVAIYASVAVADSWVTEQLRTGFS